MDKFQKEALMFYKFRLGDMLKPLNNAIETANIEGQENVTLSLSNAYLILQELIAINGKQNQRANEHIEPEEQLTIRELYNEVCGIIGVNND